MNRARSIGVAAGGQLQLVGKPPFVPAAANIYEYACDEGNYALPGILPGAREEEKAAAK